MISLKNIRDRIGQVEGYIKTTDANNYIANQGTVSSTNNLAGLPLTHYNCNGSCSWACSGSCSKGAGGGVNNQQGITTATSRNIISISKAGGWLGNQRIRFNLVNGVWSFTAETGSQIGEQLTFSDGTKTEISVNLHETKTVQKSPFPTDFYQNKTITLSATVASGTWFNVQQIVNPSAANGYNGSFLIVADIKYGRITTSIGLNVTLTSK